MRVPKKRDHYNAFFFLVFVFFPSFCGQQIFGKLTFVAASALAEGRGGSDENDGATNRWGVVNPWLIFATFHTPSPPSIHSPLSVARLPFDSCKLIRFNYLLHSHLPTSPVVEFLSCPWHPGPPPPLPHVHWLSLINCTSSFLRALQNFNHPSKPNQDFQGRAKKGRSSGWGWQANGFDCNSFIIFYIYMYIFFFIFLYLLQCPAIREAAWINQLIFISKSTRIYEFV